MWVCNNQDVFETDRSKWTLSLTYRLVSHAVCFMRVRGGAAQMYTREGWCGTKYRSTSGHGTSVQDGVALKKSGYTIQIVLFQFDHSTHFVYHSVV